MTTHRVVSRTEWLEARQQHLASEKELTRLRDRLSQERRELPWSRSATTTATTRRRSSR